MRSNDYSIRFKVYPSSSKDKHLFVVVCGVSGATPDLALNRAYDLSVLLNEDIIIRKATKVAKNVYCVRLYHYVGADKDGASRFCDRLNKQMIVLEIEELQEQLAELEKSTIRRLTKVLFSCILMA